MRQTIGMFPERLNTVESKRCAAAVTLLFLYLERRSVHHFSQVRF